MKKVLSIILTVLMILTMLVVVPFTANANEKNAAATGDGETSGTTGDCTWKIEDGVLTISGNGEMGYYYYEYNAPWLYSDFTKVVIKNGVTNISNYAFYDCISLTSVSIPDSVTSIGEDAFYNCINLTSIPIPDSVTWVGSCAFCNTAWFHNQPGDMVYAGKVAYKIKDTFFTTEVTIKDGTVSISESAFSGCTRLTSITIPDSVTNIGDSAFCDCYSLTSVTIPNSITSIGESTFSNCRNLTSISISDSVTSIGTYAFSNCKNANNITIGNSITSIDNTVFSGCTGITSLTIGSSVEDIASKAFYNCTELKRVTIPATVTGIYDKAFGYYTKEGFGETKVKDFTIYGYTGSEAQRYANDNNFTFVALDNPTEPTTQIIRGDTDGDGFISIVDTTLIQRYLAELYVPVEGIGEPIV